MILFLFYLDVFREFIVWKADYSLIGGVRLFWNLSMLFFYEKTIFSLKLPYSVFL